MYTLVAVGTYGEASRAERDVEQQIIKAEDYRFKSRWLRGDRYRLGLPDDSGYPVIRRKASESQIKRWPEFAAARDMALYERRPVHGLWLRTDALEYAPA